MKLLFFIHGITGGGAERVLVTLANAFAEQGNDVLVATDIKHPFAYSLEQNVRVLNLYDGCSNKRRKWSELYNSIKIRHNIRSYTRLERPNMVISFGAALGCTTIIATLGLRIPVVVSEHTNVSRFLGLTLSIKRNLLYPLASCITVLTRYDYSLWRKKFHNVVYMPNPVNLERLDIRQERKNVVLAAGRVNQWYIKGFDNLIRCWANLWKDFPDWRLQIAGDTDESSRKIMLALIDEAACQNVELLGFRKDIKDLMLISKVFCLSSRVEGLPMVLIEAMNAGCCCVSFDVVTGPREIIVNGESGLIAQNQNNEDLTARLRSVLENEKFRCRLAANAPISIEKYSTSLIVKRWNILFHRIIAK